MLIIAKRGGGIDCVEKLGSALLITDMRHDDSITNYDGTWSSLRGQGWYLETDAPSCMDDDDESHLRWLMN